MGGLKALWRQDSDEMLWGEVGWDGMVGVGREGKASASTDG